MSYKKASLLIAGFVVAIFSACDLNTAASPESTAIVGLFVDERDGQVYKTAFVGGRNWMAQNLNYVSENSWCYDDDSTYCALSGRLYNWYAAMSVCPAGWHLARDTDWEDLWKFVGGSALIATNLKSSKNWRSGKNGEDPYGFSIVPSGYRGLSGDYHSFTSDSHLWGYREKQSGKKKYNCAFSWNFHYFLDNLVVVDESDCKENKFDDSLRLKGNAVRCVMD